MTVNGDILPKPVAWSNDQARAFYPRNKTAQRKLAEVYLWKTAKLFYGSNPTKVRKQP